MGRSFCDEDEVMRLLLICIFILFAPVFAQAQSMTDGVLINADNMDRDQNIVRLTGNVQVVFKGQHLSCDSAIIDQSKEQITAQGHVVLYNEKVHVEGDKIVFNYKENTGYIYSGFVQSGQVVFEGDVIQKMSEMRYIASNGNYTACETCPPGWSFSGRTIDAELGGYARIRRPIFRIGGFPVMILPSLIVPLKSARQSGFLVPTFGSSTRGGAEFGESYFWAISRSSDLTLTPKWYQNRGFKAHADYRYVLAKDSDGQLRTAWLKDRRSQKDLNTNHEYDRWFIWYKHRLELPEDYVSRVDIKQVSDLRYPRDFPLEILGHGDPALENKVSITKSYDNHQWSVEGDMYTNLLKAKALSDNDDAVHRLPEIRYNMKEQNLFDTGLYLRLNAQYVNFARGKYNYDDLRLVGNSRLPANTIANDSSIVRDGSFDPGVDLFRTGQRLDVQPTFTYPFQIARRFDVLPQVTYRETQYRFFPSPSAEAAGFGPSAARRYLEGSLAVKTEFSRVFGKSNPDGSRLKHAIEPEVSYSQIFWKRTPNHIFFGKFHGLQFSRQFEQITDQDLNVPPGGIRDINTGLQFDYQDRTYAKQVVDFTLTNRLTRKTFQNGEAQYRTVAIFGLGQSYDINEARSETPHPWSSVNALADVRFENFETYTTAQYNGYAKVTNLSSRFKVMVTPKQWINLNYTRNFTLDDNYALVANGETRNFGFGLGASSKYFDIVSQFDYEARTWKLQSYGYGIALRPPGKCWVIVFKQSQVVGGFPSTNAAFSFDFGGEQSNKSTSL
jgi:LPS-assembly protein